MNSLKLNRINDTNQLSEALRECLCKAEALALIAATIELDAYTPEIINNYMWVLSDIISQARTVNENSLSRPLENVLSTS